MKDTRPNPDQPLVVNDGRGVDSLAVLVGLQERGIRPDLIIHADVGSEKPETYGHAQIIADWCKKVGFPEPVTITRFDVIKAKATTTYRTIEEHCHADETLPSIAYGFTGHTCSIKWKAEGIARYIAGNKNYNPEKPDGPGNVPGWAPAKAAWAAKGKITHVIGYDNGNADCRRSDRNAKYEGGNDTCPEHICDRWYPLQDWDWDRAKCVEAITRAGLPIPVKSACFFCPASKPWEVLWMAGRHPDLLFRSFAIESAYQGGKHYRETEYYKIGKKKGQPKDKAEGLWFTKTWRGYCEAQGITAPGEDRIIMPLQEIKDKVLALMPATAGTEQIEWANSIELMDADDFDLDAFIDDLLAEEEEALVITPWHKTAALDIPELALT